MKNIYKVERIRNGQKIGEMLVEAGSAAEAYAETKYNFLMNHPEHDDDRYEISEDFI